MPADRVKQKVINLREGSTQILPETSTSSMPVSCGPPKNLSENLCVSDGKSTFLTLS